MNIEEVVELFAAHKCVVLSTNRYHEEAFLKVCENKGIVWNDGKRATQYIPSAIDQPIVFYFFSNERGIRFSYGPKNYHPRTLTIDLNEVSMEEYDEEMPEIETSSLLDILMK